MRDDSSQTTDMPLGVQLFLIFIAFLLTVGFFIALASLSAWNGGGIG